jgi:exopolysaccharide production protein ExoZ
LPGRRASPKGILITTSVLSPRKPSIAVRRVHSELQSIQALRAIAATSVILIHIPFIAKGGFGVDIFFVISGFIICYISALNAENFVLKRIFRVIPLYWLGTLGVFLIALAFPAWLNSTTAKLSSLAKSMLMIPYKREDGAVLPMLFLGWTLEYEMFFYLVFGLALAFFKKWASLAASFVLIIAVLAGRLFEASSTIPRFYSNPIILEFVLGMAVFAIWKRYRDSLARIPVFAALIVSVGCYVYLYMGTSGVGRNDRPFFQGLPAVLIVLSFLAVEGRIHFPRWLLLVGDASYSLYLFHPYVIQLVDKKIMSLSVLTPATLIVSLVAIFVCFPLAILSFRIVEKPSNEFLRRKFIKARPRITAEHTVGV